MNGNPIFRFRLIHPIEGTFDISEPIGWVGTKLSLERDEQFKSLVERFTGAFSFYGDNGSENGGINLIRYFENKYGLDDDLFVDIDVSFDGGTVFEDIFYGLYDFSETEENNLNQIQSAIIRNDFWVKFINRQDTPVNIQSTTGLDGDAVDVIPAINMILTGQIIPRTTTYTGEIVYSNDLPLQYEMPSGTYIDASGIQESFTTYTQATVDLDQDEIEDSFNTVIDFISDPLDITPQIELPNEGGQIKVTFANTTMHLQLDGSLFMDSSEVDPSSIDTISVIVQVFAQLNSDTPVFMAGGGDSVAGPPNPSLVGVDTPFIKTFEIVLPSGPGVPEAIFNMAATDTLRVYARYQIFFNIDVGADTGTIKYGTRVLTVMLYEPVVSFVIQSTFGNTEAEVFLIHDVARSIIDRTTSQNNSLISEYLGNNLTSPSYPDNGCGSRYVNVQGLQIRKYLLSDKPYALSFKQFWEGIDPILNLGLGYTNDQNKIEILPQEDFFDPTISVYFDYVNDIIRRYDNDVIFNKVDVGYQKWQSENLSGIDDAQTKHSYATRFKKVGRAIPIVSGFIAASLAIETTRRTTQKKSSDYKYDNETFIIAVSELDITPAALKPETDENFTFITGLQNPSTRYNSRITPARNLIRWLRHLNGGLQSYLGSVYKFLSGEGNFDMDSDLDNGDCDDFTEAVSEKQDIEVTNDYNHLPDLFEINMPMRWDQYNSIRNNRKKAIGISQTDIGHTAFFIKTLEYDICYSRAVIQAWPKTRFSIQNIDFTPPSVVCQPSPAGCDDTVTRATEDFDYRVTEFGECREIE